MTKIRTKVSGISSLTDARYCAGMGVDVLSLDFDSNGLCILTPDAFRAIRAWIEGVEWFGEYSGQDLAVLREIADNYELNTWILKDFPLHQLVSNEVPEKEWILSFDVDPENQPDSLPEKLETCFSTYSETMARKILRQLEGSGLRLIKGPKTAQEILSLQQEFPDLIFSLQSGTEERPGWMDLSQLQDVLEKLEDMSGQDEY